MSLIIWSNYIKFKKADHKFDELSNIKLCTLKAKSFIHYLSYYFPECVIDKDSYPGYYEIKIRKGRDINGNAYSFIMTLSKKDGRLDIRMNVNNHIACYKKIYDGSLFLSAVMYDIKLNLIKNGVRV